MPTRQPPYRVIIWGTGSVGRPALREVLRNPNDFELVGVKVANPAKVGKRADELAGERTNCAVTATDDASRLPFETADCILYCPQAHDYEEIAGFLRRGVNVVTTASNVYPRWYGAEVFDALDEAGKQGGATFHGSGTNPGFVSDVLPITLTGLSHRVQKISVREVTDINHYASTAPEIMCDYLGFGKSAEEVSRSAASLKGMTAYFSEAILSITDALGVSLERVDEHHEVALAQERVILDGGRVIEPGSVGCRSFEWRGVVDGEVRIVLSTLWWLTPNLSPAWDVKTSDLAEWRIFIEGTPSFRCVLATAASFDPDNPACGKGSEEAAVISAAAHAVNAVPYVVKAAPGVRTFLDLPIIASAGAFRR